MEERADLSGAAGHEHGEAGRGAGHGRRRLKRGKTSDEEEGEVGDKRGEGNEAGCRSGSSSLNLNQIPSANETMAEASPTSTP